MKKYKLYFYILIAVLTVLALAYLSLGSKRISQNYLKERLAHDFEKCDVSNESRKCWLDVLNDYFLNHHSDSKSISDLVREVNQLTCSAPSLEKKMSEKDLKLKCHNILGKIIYTYEKDQNVVQKLCEIVSDGKLASARFCMSGFYTHYYFENKIEFPKDNTLNLNYCSLNNKFFVNCLKALFNSYKSDWGQIAENINKICNIDNSKIERCYIAYGATVVYEDFVSLSVENSEKLCSEVNASDRKHCIKGMLNTFLVQDYDFDKGKKYCESLRGDDALFCKSFVEKDFFIGR